MAHLKNLHSIIARKKNVLILLIFSAFGFNSFGQTNENPPSGIPSNVEIGKVHSLDKFETFEIHPGIKAKLFWGSGVMVSVAQLEPQERIPEKILSSDRFLFLMEGNIEQFLDGEQVSMLSLEREEPDGIHSGTPRIDFIYLEKGTRQGIQAGAKGAKFIEIYSPINADYLEKSGVEFTSAVRVENETSFTPNVNPKEVYDLFETQLTQLSSGAYSRLISGNNMLLSFISMEPNSALGPKNYPEEQIIYILRGTGEKKILDEVHSMESEDVIRIPANYEHGAKIGEVGSDALNIFWPPNSEYLDKANEAKIKFHTYIPTDSELELVIDGKKSQPELFFTEGPKWFNGKLYFSNMYFDQDFNADPARSSTVEMDPDGSYRNITQGKMQTNGLYPYKNGNLLVCDMMGHRVVEMTTNGQVVRVLADTYQGKPIDGPNDIVTDSKGGFYFTDPQFTMEEEKFQPGRAVYYVSPQGKITRITEPNEFAMPNGIVLSPNGKTLYINNTYDKETWYPVQSEKDNYIWAYDVEDDGTIKNGRKFANVLLVGEVLDRKGRSSGADGMAIDTEGNLYVATYYGVQIFDATGNFVGMINMPSFPVSLTFGDEDMKTLYIVSYNKVFKIRTNKEGYINYLD